MANPYKNPQTPLLSVGTFSVQPSQTFGTNFSIYGVGGYVEVYELQDLIYTIPSGSQGDIEFSGNTIPIQFQKGSGSVFSPDVLTLNSDNISSGRRRLGMLAYVYSTQEIFQYNIPNYTTLWNNALASSGPGGPTVVQSKFGTTVKSNSVAGKALISAWTGSTIQGHSGGTANSNWRLLDTGGCCITGFTYNNDNSFTIYDDNGGVFTASFDVVTGLTVSGGTLIVNGVNITGDTYTTGGTYFSASSTIDLYDNQGGIISITGITLCTGHGTMLLFCTKGGRNKWGQRPKKHGSRSVPRTGQIRINT